MKPIIEVQGLTLRYTEGGQKILDSISLQINRGSITAIAGLSGCGKSTLAYCLCGVIPKSLPGIVKGSVMIDGIDISGLSLPALAQKIGMVFQDVDNQLFLPTVEAEIAFAPENMCLPADSINERVVRVIDKLRIELLRYTNPSKLSGGEKRLIAVGTVLSLDPEVIILDEVFSELDADNKALMAGYIKLLQEAGKTIIIIDHSTKHLMMADTILLMNNGKIDRVIEVDAANELLCGRLTEFFLSE